MLGNLNVTFVYFCRGSRMAALLLSYHSIVAGTSRDDVSASAICQFWRFILVYSYIYLSLHVSLAAFVAYFVMQSFALLHRGYSRRIEGWVLCL